VNNGSEVAKAVDAPKRADRRDDGLLPADDDRNRAASSQDGKHSRRDRERGRTAGGSIHEGSLQLHDRMIAATPLTRN
jgi:hypothetical protein